MLCFFLLADVAILLPYKVGKIPIMDHTCKNIPSRFCYICGNVVLPKCRAKIIDFVKKVYRDYLGVKLGNQDKLFVPHVCSKTCLENLRD